MNSSLGHIVQTNHGIFSRAQAVECGETDQSLAAARRSALLYAASCRFTQAASGVEHPQRT